MADRCCNEYRCERKKPFLLRRGFLSGRIHLITDYKPAKHSEHVIEALRKHDMTAEVEAFMAAEWNAAFGEEAWDEVRESYEGYAHPWDDGQVASVFGWLEENGYGVVKRAKQEGRSAG